MHSAERGVKTSPPTGASAGSSSIAPCGSATSGSAPPGTGLPPTRVAVVIDPGRAFGTGGHPTTQLCIELLCEQERSSIVDLGCGSGVLAIVAAKLGFEPVVALDTDENAVVATIRNAATNGVTVDARRADVLSDELPQTDAAVANITYHALQALGPRLRCRHLVSSGYLPSDPPECSPFRHVRRVARDGWAADLFEAA